MNKKIKYTSFHPISLAYVKLISSTRFQRHNYDDDDNNNNIMFVHIF